MLTKIKHWFHVSRQVKPKPEPKPEPKYRLIPTAGSTYNLEKLSEDNNSYILQLTDINAGEAKKYIKQLERDIINIDP